MGLMSGVGSVCRPDPVWGWYVGISLHVWTQHTRCHHVLSWPRVRCSCASPWTACPDPATFQPDTTHLDLAVPQPDPHAVPSVHGHILACRAMLSGPWGSLWVQKFANRGTAINTATAFLLPNFPTCGVAHRLNDTTTQVGVRTPWAEWWPAGQRLSTTILEERAWSHSCNSIS